MEDLFAHQKKIIADDPKKVGLFLGTGSSKTRLGLELAQGTILVIAPKTQIEDGNWERENAKWNINKKLVSITFDKFKTSHESLPLFDTVIVDEVHGMLGVTPATCQRKRVLYPRASQRFEALSAYLERTKPSRLYLCTATIMKSPFTVWAAGKLLAHPLMRYDLEGFYNFRYEFYTKLPMGRREVWVPKKDSHTKVKVAALVRQLGYIGRLADYFDVPPQTFKTEYVALTDAQKDRIKELRTEFPEPLVRVGKIHQVENGVLTGDEFNKAETFDNAKVDKILEYALEFPRMVVFARYTGQIAFLRRVLTAAGYKVLTLEGATKDRGSLIADANASQECIVIAQCQIGAGWELPEYPVMIFASRDYSFVNYDQCIGRIHRANALKKNLYINLVVRNGVDQAVDEALAHKSDFSERLYSGV
jgi:hypothetical protein